MKYLIIHDSNDISKKIKKIINGQDNEAEIFTACSASSARCVLSDHELDIAILDLNLPENEESLPAAEVGKNLMIEMSTSSRLISPRHIFGITSRSEMISEYRNYFEERSHSIIDTDKEWQRYLQHKIKYLLKVNKQFSKIPTVKQNIDVCIITALEEELAPYLKLLTTNEITIPGDPITYYETKITSRKSQTFNIIICTLDAMGISSTTALATKIIYNFAPKYLCITGICAGIGDDFNLGDLIITERSFDYSFGKLDEQENEIKFKPSQNSHSISTTLKQKVIKIKQNIDLVQEACRNIQPIPSYLSTPSRVGSGATCSGPFVVKSKKIKALINELDRKILALDMETYSLFVASASFDRFNQPEIISIKSICDKADEQKDDTLHHYCSNLSASYLIKIIEHDLLPKGERSSPLTTSDTGLTTSIAKKLKSIAKHLCPMV